jgi:hypothetical protein
MIRYFHQVIACGHRILVRGSLELAEGVGEEMLAEHYELRGRREIRCFVLLVAVPRVCVVVSRFRVDVLLRLPIFPTGISSQCSAS